MRLKDQHNDFGTNILKTVIITVANMTHFEEAWTFFLEHDGLEIDPT